MATAEGLISPARTELPTLGCAMRRVHVAQNLELHFLENPRAKDGASWSPVLLWSIFTATGSQQPVLLTTPLGQTLLWVWDHSSPHYQNHEYLAGGAAEVLAPSSAPPGSWILLAGWGLGTCTALFSPPPHPYCFSCAKTTTGRTPATCPPLGDPLWCCFLGSGLWNRNRVGPTDAPLLPNTDAAVRSHSSNGC